MVTNNIFMVINYCFGTLLSMKIPLSSQTKGLSCLNPINMKN